MDTGNFSYTDADDEFLFPPLFDPSDITEFDQVQPLTPFDAPQVAPSTIDDGWASDIPQLSDIMYSSTSLPVSSVTVSASSSSVDTTAPTGVTRSSLKRARDVSSSARSSHRELDAQRRKRERSALDRIRHMLRAVDGKNYNQTDRASILDTAANALAQLLELTKQRNQTRNDIDDKHDDDAVRADDNSLSPLDTASHTVMSRALIAHSVRADSFFAEIFMNSTVVQLIFNADSGTLLYVNDVYTASSGKTRAMVERQKSLLPRSHFLHGKLPKYIFDPNRYIRQADGSLAPPRYIEQSAESIASIADLYRNNKSIVHIRLRTADSAGQQMENTVRFSLTSSRHTVLPPGCLAVNGNTTLVHLYSDVRQYIKPIKA